MLIEDPGLTPEQAFSGRRVVVTGGAGFVGRHLVRQLTQIGASVAVVDTKPFPDEAVQTVLASVLDEQALADAFKGADVVFHLAGLVGVERVEQHPLAVLQVNLQGTVSALEAATKAGVARFLFTSSSEVYGEPQRIPIREDDPRAPVSIYGVSKLAAEGYCQAYQHERGLATTIVRYFNVYGPYQEEAFVIPIWIHQILQGDPPTIYGNGEQVRSYTYVDDAVRGTLLAAARPESVGEVFNIGHGEATRIRDLADFLIQALGSDLKPRFRYWGDGIRLESREVMRRVPDISKARLMLGYRPRIGLEDGVRRFIEAMRT